jgi:hypothetical protein
VYFGIFSSVITAAEMSERIGLAPDRQSVRGSRNSQPGHRPVPYHHSWQVLCEDKGVGVGLGEQVERVVQRLVPHQDRIRDPVEEVERVEPDGQAGSVLRLVRLLDDEDGELDGWQHRLLGWTIDSDTLAFLVMARATIDADDYGQGLPWWRPLSRRRYARG